MTVRLSSFSSASASSSAHTGDYSHSHSHSRSLSHQHSHPSTYEYLSAFEHHHHGDINDDMATQATEASWREQAHWCSFRDAVHRIQNQLVLGGASVNTKKKKDKKSRSRPVPVKFGSRPPVGASLAATGAAMAPVATAVPSPSRNRPYLLHQGVADALRSPSPLEIERDLHLYRHDVESMSKITINSRSDEQGKYLANYPSPTREEGSYVRISRRHEHHCAVRETIDCIPEGDDEHESSSEDSLDGLVRSVVPGAAHRGGLLASDPPTTSSVPPSNTGGTNTNATPAQKRDKLYERKVAPDASSSVDAEGTDIPIIPDCIPKSVHADRSRRTVVEPSPLRPHDHVDEEDGDEDDEGKEGDEVLVSRTEVGHNTSAPQPPLNNRAPSPHPSIQSAHSSESRTTTSSSPSSRQSYSTGGTGSGTSSSYGSSFDPRHLEEETRQRALETHLAETQLKLALVEAERDEMEFELLKKKKRG